jgi:coenzyme F420-0:L-glutamate ligase/coenzyme F420-1:gamma-L-glutamate ligase
MAKSITYFAVPGLPLINPGDDLAALIVDALKAEQLQLMSGDIVVVAQKIASKAENRYVELKDVRPSEPAQTLADQTGKDPRYVEVVLSESAEVVRHRRNILIVAHRLGWPTPVSINRTSSTPMARSVCCCCHAIPMARQRR